jgi:hypothetical protein
VVKFTKAGTAGSGDYTLSAGGITITTSVTIPAGVDHVDVFVDPTNDVVVEPIETVILKLAASPSTYNLDPDAADITATVTILDNEPFVSVAVLGFSGADAVAGETFNGQPTNTAKFRISRTTTGPALTVNIKLGGTAKRGVKLTHDYFITVNGVLVTSSKIIIPNGATFIDVVVNAIDDTLPEGGGGETVILTLTKASSRYKLDPDAADITSTVTIVDNEPVVSVVAIDAVASEPGGDANIGKFRISRTGSVNSALEVIYKVTGTAIGGTDYVKIPTKIIIPAGLSFIDIDVQPLVDGINEVPELITLSLVAVSKVYGLQPTAAAATVTLTDGSAEPGADLVILASSHSAKVFRLSTNTSAMGISATVKNQGASGTASASQIRVLLSADRNPSGDDIVMGVINVGVLAAGATAGVSGSFAITGLGLSPDDIGNYFVILIADINSAITESIESNNIIVSFLNDVTIIL